MKPIRYLYLGHRWLGIVMCSFFAMWFFSGVVMMYVGFPSLTETERLNGLPILKAEQIKLPVTALSKDLSNQTSIEQLTLTTVLNRPAYLLKTADQPWRGMYADNGELFSGISKKQSLAAARHFAGQSHIATTDIHYAEQLLQDQWSVSSSLEPYRPLHRIELGDTAGQQLYISALTGQVVRDTNHTERLWNWLGANLHWIYPVQLRKHPELWSDVVIWLSLLGLVSLITGSVIGILRLRVKKPYRGTSYTPYRGLMKYHHLLGLSCLLFLSTYLFSGLMSMNPWDIFSEKKDFSTQLQRYQTNGNSMLVDNALATILALQQILTSNPQTKEVHWHWLGGKAYSVLNTTSQQIVLQPDNSKAILADKIQRALPSLIPGSSIESQQFLNQYDLYYYSHHERSRPVPILRVIFNDEESSWFHIDPSTGEVLEKLTSAARLQRWLFNALHSFDFSFLINHRPVWDVLVITLCSLGFVFSATSLVIAWRRLTFRRKRERSKGISELGLTTNDELRL
ncbi:MAG: PepSY domain-containing protein [Pseudomonadales bacterium]